MRDWDDVIGFLLGATLFVLAAGVAVVIGCAATDFLMDRHTFAAQVACLEQQKQPQRKALSTVVVCVPRPQRRDTLGLQQVKP